MAIGDDGIAMDVEPTMWFKGGPLTELVDQNLRKQPHIPQPGRAHDEIPIPDSAAREGWPTRMITPRRVATNHAGSSLSVACWVRTRKARSGMSVTAAQIAGKRLPLPANIDTMHVGLLIQAADVIEWNWGREDGSGGPAPRGSSELLKLNTVKSNATF